jgi:hypothetical protein
MKTVNVSPNNRVSVSVALGGNTRVIVQLPNARTLVCYTKGMDVVLQLAIIKASVEESELAKAPHYRWSLSLGERSPRTN